MQDGRVGWCGLFYLSRGAEDPEKIFGSLSFE